MARNNSKAVHESGRKEWHGRIPTPLTRLIRVPRVHQSANNSDHGWNDQERSHSLVR
jgi:hypothetical protein